MGVSLYKIRSEFSAFRACTCCYPQGALHKLADGTGGGIMSSMILSHHLRLAYFLAALAVSPAMGVLAAADPPQLHNTLGTDNPTTPPIHNALPSTNEAATDAKNSSANDEAASDLPAALRKSLTIALKDVPFENALSYLSTKAGLNITANWAALQSARVDKTTTISIRITRPVSVASILNMLCSAAGGTQANLTWTVGQDEIIVVSTKDELQSAAYQFVRMYDIHDLIGDELPTGTKRRDDCVHEITALLTSTVAPDSWRDTGGTIGSIREIDDILIINQTAENHRAIKKVLAQIRAIHAVRQHRKYPDHATPYPAPAPALQEEDHPCVIFPSSSPPC